MDVSIADLIQTHVHLIVDVQELIINIIVINHLTKKLTLHLRLLIVVLKVN